MHSMNAVFAAIDADATRIWRLQGEDGNSKQLRDQVKFFKYGRDEVFPPEWQTYLDKVTREADPEYAEYQRLQKKFAK